jgi:hypothetical protein
MGLPFARKISFNLMPLVQFLLSFFHPVGKNEDQLHPIEHPYLNAILRPDPSPPEYR